MQTTLSLPGCKQMRGLNASPVGWPTAQRRRRRRRRQWTQPTQNKDYNYSYNYSLDNQIYNQAPQSIISPTQREHQSICRRSAARVSCAAI